MEVQQWEREDGNQNYTRKVKNTYPERAISQIPYSLGFTSNLIFSDLIHYLYKKDFSDRRNYDSHK